jgi:dTDP-4-amino-4,6-dideoxygalactose transaminase
VLLRGDLARYTTRGPSEAQRFERELASAMGVQHALGVNSGTSGLICALVGAGIGPGDEVLVPAYTWVSSAAAALAVGAVPVLVEIDETLTLDLTDLAAKITPNTKAIIPVHMQNLVCDMDGILKLARAHGLKVVEDACQAIGVRYKGTPVGAIGDVGVFSFQQYKNIHSGEGGAIVTNDARTYNRARMYHDVGSYTRSGRVETEEPLFVGVNLRMPEISAAVLRPQLKLLNARIARLRAHRKLAIERLGRSRYRSRFEICPHHDPEAAAGLSVYFRDPEEAREFAAASRGITRLIDTGRHVYTNWESLQGWQPMHPKFDPYAWARASAKIGPESCPKTVEILSRTCLIPLRPEFPTVVYRTWLTRMAP